MKMLGRNVEDSVITDIFSKKLHPRLQEVLFRETSEKPAVKLEDLVPTLDDICEIYNGSQSKADDQLLENTFVARASRGRSVGHPRLCFYCKEPGHVVANCKKRKQICGRYEPPVKRTKFPVKQAFLSGEEVSKQQIDSQEFVCFATAFVGESRSEQTTWILDSGATRHMTWDEGLLKSPTDLERPIEIALANNRRINATKCGYVETETELGYDLKLIDVLFVPQACE